MLDDGHIFGRVSCQRRFDLVSDFFFLTNATQCFLCHRSKTKSSPIFWIPIDATTWDLLSKIVSQPIVLCIAA